MRTEPRSNRSPRAHRWGASIALAALLALGPALPAPADVKVVRDGRRARTGPKLPQSALDGIPLRDPADAPRESGRELRIRGRKLHSKPSEEISVGLLGCPGCTTVLGALGGIYLDIGLRDRRGPRDERPRFEWAPGRDVRRDVGPAPRPRPGPRR